MASNLNKCVFQLFKWVSKDYIFVSKNWGKTRLLLVNLLHKVHVIKMNLSNIIIGSITLIIAISSNFSLGMLNTFSLQDLKNVWGLV